MTKKEARQKILDAGATEAEKIEARKVLKLSADGTQDSTVTGTETDTDTTADQVSNSAGKATEAVQAQPGSGTSQTGGFNNMDASNTNETMQADNPQRDSYPNPGDSADINKPNTIDSGAAAAAAIAANTQRFGNRPRAELLREDTILRRTPLTGEVDSVTTETSAPGTAPSDAAHPTQRYMDNRGYSNTREVVAPIVQPTVHVPVSNMVHYISEDGTVIGSVERGAEKTDGAIIVIGGKEWVTVGGALGANGNSIPVRQNLPQPVN